MEPALDDSQREAVLSKARHTLVVAGPGSGKTRVLAARLSELIGQGADPGRILAVTFTNKAAGEMRERSPRGPFIGTFHAVSLRLLKARYPLLKLYGREEQERVLKEIGCAEKGALDKISAIKNGVEGGGCEFYPAYDERLRAEGAVDLDDLAPEAARLIETGGESPFAHVLIDEYQDINPAQGRLARALAMHAETLFAIGDPDQAIYSFRGSSARCFLSFAQDYPGAKRLGLGRNYRSGSVITEAAGALISHNRERLAFKAEPVAEGGSVEHTECADEREEAAFIASEIESMMGGLSSLTASDSCNLRFSDFAVLVRTNRCAERLYENLCRHSPPFHLASPPAAELRELIRRIESMPPARGAAAVALVRAEAERLSMAPAAIEALIDALSMDAERSIQEAAAELLFSSPAEAMEIKADRVNVMTVHAAKGLEWRCVFISGVEDGLMPMRREGSDIEEERRLFYVAATRAKERLVLTSARSRRLWGEDAESAPSPFIGEMGESVSRKSRARRQPARRPRQKGLFD